MALPPQDKTWQFSPNLPNPASGSSTTTSALGFVVVKNTLKAFATLPWTVIGSSDGSTASMEGTDRIVDETDFVCATAGNPHTWIVLEQAGNGSQICFDFVGNNPALAKVLASPSGVFTGGTTSDRPTATDELSIVQDPPDYLGLGAFNLASMFHVWHSTDGKNTFVVQMYDASGTQTIGALWILGEVKPSINDWDHPRAWFLRGSSGSASLGSYQILFRNKVFHAWGPDDSIVTMAMSCYGRPLLGREPLIEYLPARTDNTNNKYVQTMGLYSVDVGKVGRYGQIIDIWLIAAGLADGTTFPSTGPRKNTFVTFKQWVFPWEDGLTVTSA